MEVLTGSVVSPGKAFQPLSVFIEYHGARVGWRGQEDGRGELRKKRLVNCSVEGRDEQNMCAYIHRESREGRDGETEGPTDNVRTPDLVMPDAISTLGGIKLSFYIKLV